MMTTACCLWIELYPGYAGLHLFIVSTSYVLPCWYGNERMENTREGCHGHVTTTAVMRTFHMCLLESYRRDQVFYFQSSKYLVATQHAEWVNMMDIVNKNTLAEVFCLNTEELKRPKQYRVQPYGDRGWIKCSCSKDFKISVYVETSDRERKTQQGAATCFLCSPNTEVARHNAFMYYANREGLWRVIGVVSAVFPLHWQCLTRGRITGRGVLNCYNIVIRWVWCWTNTKSCQGESRAEWLGAFFPQHVMILLWLPPHKNPFIQSCLIISAAVLVTGKLSDCCTFYWRNNVITVA